MWRQWFSWKTLISAIARRKGFIDPIALLAQLQRFAKPSEVAAPVELLRLSMVLQARGIMNSQAIQHNLDWVWPFWVTRQFDPQSKSFIPRAFSVTHINMTHRNWTAVGLPDYEHYPIVDPRGLVTPHYDGWSIDAWILPENGEPVLPSQADEKLMDQRLCWDKGLAVRTGCRTASACLETETTVELSDEGNPECVTRIQGRHEQKSWLAVSLRPFNPEGVSFIHKIRFYSDENTWRINGKHRVHLDQSPAHQLMSTYAEGDVFGRFPIASESGQAQKVDCPVGMATAMALYLLKPGEASDLSVRMPLKPLKKAKKAAVAVNETSHRSWDSALQGACRFEVPDKHFEYLYDAALRSVILHATQEDIYPGPYTYKHFWFRDAVMILNSILSVGLRDRAEQLLNTFPSRQRLDGYFCSQDGEWDSNGQVLWLLDRYLKITRKPLSSEWRSAATKAAQWIVRKRTAEEPGIPHGGLMPAGFSAEHFGPNDFYFWDDFWSVAGLEAAEQMMRAAGSEREANKWRDAALSMRKSIDRALEHAALRVDSEAMPSSPYRRLDSGAIGSLAADYPLRLWPAEDKRIQATLKYLWDNCRVSDGFYHDMSHSGINPYLTVHLAQGFMRQGDVRGWQLLESLAAKASPTGQWPEAMHPRTDGGCMGDGQHVWASAEWLQVMRDIFVREEGQKLLLFSGIPRQWLAGESTLHFGPAPTEFGTIDVRLISEAGKRKLMWKADWFDGPPELIFAPLEGQSIKLDPLTNEAEIGEFSV